jgi:hypothetical protein
MFLNIFHLLFTHARRYSFRPYHRGCRLEESIQEFLRMDYLHNEEADLVKNTEESQPAFWRETNVYGHITLKAPVLV